MFSFKQFTIHQDNCAMKVCTDACLFGAWVADKMEKAPIAPLNILDIGTGTGLLSLMLAQKLEGHLDAVEIDAAAAGQASENFNASPWKERLTIQHTRLQDFAPAKKYDLIISNPPFYEADLRSADHAKNAAKHDTTLTLDELVKWISGNLSANGSAALLIPAHRSEFLEAIAAKAGLFLKEKASVKQTPAHACFRTMFLFSKKEEVKKEEEIVIHNEKREYTEGFVGLLKDYYLKRMVP